MHLTLLNREVFNQVLKSVMSNRNNIGLGLWHLIQTLVFQINIDSEEETRSPRLQDEGHAKTCLC